MHCLIPPLLSPRERHFKRLHGLLPQSHRQDLPVHTAQLKPTPRGLAQTHCDLRHLHSPSRGCHLRRRRLHLVPFLSSSRHHHHPLHGPPHLGLWWGHYPLQLSPSPFYNRRLHRRSPQRPACSTMATIFQIFCLLRPDSYQRRAVLTNPRHCLFPARSNR